MTPKIADFGLSRFLNLHDEVQTTNTNALPIRWMSPESLKNRSYSYKSDVWSWAVLVSEIINREEPYSGFDLLDGKSETYWRFYWRFYRSTLADH
jgi:serine/threonine protein kinase